MSLVDHLEHLPPMVCRSDLRGLGLRRNDIDRIYSRCQVYAVDVEARIKYVSRDDVISCVQAMPRAPHPEAV